MVAGNDDAMIQVDKTLNNNVPSYEQDGPGLYFTLKAIADSAKKCTAKFMN